MNAEQVNDLIGMPYGEYAFGPDSFNCWGLLHYVQRKYFHINMPVAPIGDAAGCVAMFDEQMHAGTWERLDAPVHGAGALMKGGVEPHVGTYLDFDGGGILHAVRGMGVIWSPAHQLRKEGYGKTTYYRLG